MTNQAQLEQQAIAYFLQRQQDLAQHYPAVSSYKLVFGGGKRRLGSCHPQRKIIRLSRHFLTLNPFSVTQDTINHELAHAIDYARRGKSNHDQHWQRIAIALGASPQASTNATSPEPRWSVVWIKPHNRQIQPVARYHRRARSLKGASLANQPASKDRLFYLETQILKQFEKRILAFEQIVPQMLVR